MLQFWKRDQPQSPQPFDRRELSGIDREQDKATRRLRYWEMELAAYPRVGLND